MLSFSGVLVRVCGLMLLYLSGQCGRRLEQINHLRQIQLVLNFKLIKGWTFVLGLLFLSPFRTPFSCGKSILLSFHHGTCEHKISEVLGILLIICTRHAPVNSVRMPLAEVLI